MQPNSGITFGYEGYVVRLKNGEEVAGYVESQTPQTLTLKSLGGISTRYDLSQIESRKEFPGSMMPTGLANAMSQRQFVDLVEYLSSRRTAPSGAAR